MLRQPQRATTTGSVAWSHSSWLSAQPHKTVSLVVISNTRLRLHVSTRFSSDSLPEICASQTTLTPTTTTTTSTFLLHLVLHHVGLCCSRLRSLLLELRFSHYGSGELCNLVTCFESTPNQYSLPATCLIFDQDSVTVLQNPCDAFCLNLGSRTTVWGSSAASVWLTRTTSDHFSC